MDIVTITSAAVSALGIGGAIGAWLTARLHRRNEIAGREHELKRTRYLCIILLMLAKLNRDDGLKRLAEKRPDLLTGNDLDAELTSELMNAVIFADKDVIESLAGFIRHPTYDWFVTAAIAMRRDLWGRGRAQQTDVRNILNATSRAIAVHAPELLLK